MAHEIEADFKDNWLNEASQCKNCTSFSEDNGIGVCSEAKSEVAANAHCDFFQSRD